MKKRELLAYLLSNKDHPDDSEIVLLKSDGTFENAHFVWFDPNDPNELGADDEPIDPEWLNVPIIIIAPN